MGFAKVISADSHVMEPRDLWFNALAKRYGEHAPQLRNEHLGKPGTFFYTGAQVIKVTESDRDAQKIGLQAAGYDPAVRLDFQNRAGVQGEVLYATLMLLIMRGEQRAVVRAAAAVFNDWLAEFCSHDNKRLFGVGMIPMDDPDWAEAELHRIAKKGLRGAMIHLSPPEGCAPYHDPLYDRFWAAAQDLDLPITLHIVAGRFPDPLHFHTAKEQEDAPRVLLSILFEVMNELANEFIFGGILDRFEKLKLVCSEFEISWIPNFMWRLDQMQDDFDGRLNLRQLKMKASDYMKTRIWHGIIDDPLGADAIKALGIERVMWGSDFPHVRSIGLDAHSRLAKLFDGLNPADQAKLIEGNVCGVYKI